MPKKQHIDEYTSWLNSSKYLQDKKDYSKNISEEVRGLALIVWKEEDSFVWWYMNSKLEELNNKTPYEYARFNDNTKIKRLINWLISPPAV